MVDITEDMIERGAVALINADALEPHDRDDGRWRPAVLAEAVLRGALRSETMAVNAGDLA